MKTLQWEYSVFSGFTHEIYLYEGLISYGCSVVDVEWLILIVCILALSNLLDCCGVTDVK